MQSFPETVVLRHRKENLKKCSLIGLEERDDFIFLKYPTDTLAEMPGYILLAVDAPPLTEEDCERGLFVLDATWKLAGTMQKMMGPFPSMVARSIPSDFRTAYPRRQDDCPEPSKGLASVEALYIAYLLMGRDVTGLLDNYYWRESFLEKNKHLLI
ncbi:MAG: pre-rRNA-processing protein TSR3 [Chlamydiales bacterium]|jgi:pre-rRNA-processing protein TSR3